MTTTKITIKAEVNAPVQKAWFAYTDPYAITQWNFASDDWHCPKAENDLRVGGKLKSRMEAKDGSFGFDFEAVYDEVVDQKRISYVLGDGRKVITTFEDKGEKTLITTTFDAEGEHPVEMQEQGWQAILNNYKAYAERIVNLEPLHFSVEIKASVEKVFDTMLADKTYREWTAEFNPGSFYRGSWSKGSRILFLGVNQAGKEEGMVGTIRESIPNKFVSIEHQGLVSNGVEITSGPAIKGWAGAHENYTFAQSGKGTMVTVDVDSNNEYKGYFSDAWPRALNKLKQICEAN
ncbi:MAG: SRPBCC domain-containing protein [Cyclobacteriaceae bacterium]|nr:SRPBCC domain-containing protein [Cyclobacteriaceae bacterium]